MSDQKRDSSKREESAEPAYGFQPPDASKENANQPVEAWMIPGPYTGVGPVGWKRPDRRIETELTGKLEKAEITARVAEGVVTLEGQAPDEDTRRQLEEQVRRVNGVVDVVNNLRVRLPPG